MESRSRLYGRRKGRPLHVRKAALVRELLPKIQIDLSRFVSPQKESRDLGEDLGRDTLDPRTLFPLPLEALWLEIGFGSGEHLAAQAELHPSYGFIGCEPFINGVAGLLDYMDARHITNIRIYPNDARHLLDALPDASVGRCFVLFADPWPKARHAERRFIGSENLPRLARVLKSGSELRLATDVASLGLWMRERMAESQDFELVSDSVTPPAEWVPTRYEQKGIKAGRQPSYMCYRKR